MKRYEIYYDYELIDGPEPDENGTWVRYHDVKAEIDRLGAEIERLKDTLAAIHAETLVPDGGPTFDDIDDVLPSLNRIHDLSRPEKKGGA